ncbi:response regulator transcription factor [Cohnella sp. AR92]|uniref:response regulator transcription factor n=1 Tax=Cohnella sp. AR92 TaxID=648716 RepID=UPI000F8F5E0C|nr:response regulator [Cohnella sp. AR92]RUS44627.1 response regulator [Cohnella sp. AR92]
MPRLLLAEDEPVLRMLVCDTLEDEGYEIDVACDGEEAMEKIKLTSYDLLILDYMMPRLSGLDVLVRARALPGGDRFKILMLSAKNQLTDKEKTAAAGADDFMSKPFSPLALSAKIEEMLHA